MIFWAKILKVRKFEDRGLVQCTCAVDSDVFIAGRGKTVYAYIGEDERDHYDFDSNVIETNYDENTACLNVLCENFSLYVVKLEGKVSKELTCYKPMENVEKVSITKRKNHSEILISEIGPDFEMVSHFSLDSLKIIQSFTCSIISPSFPMI